MNLYLCGMIGSGKTSIGKEIAKRLRWPFFDVDQIMEKEAGKRIHDIVAEEGWVSYRESEYHIAKRLSQLDRSVVATAGGTVRYEWNMDGAADFTYRTDRNKTVKEEAEEIIDLLEKTLRILT